MARDDGHGFEIKGISGELMRLFSSRRESITQDLRARAAQFEAQYGRKPSQRELAQLAQVSNFRTRAAKDGALDFAQLHAGFGYFQREVGYTRTGSHNTRVHGRETGQWHEADLAIAHWLQHTSRDGDMQLHVHSQIAHTARTVMDGKWRAPDSYGYNEQIGAVAAIVSQHL